MSEDADKQAVEVARLVRWRRREALEAGLTRVEARLWSEAQELDIGDLRRLVKKGCPKSQLARILL